MILSYDPLTTRQEGAGFVRLPFEGNRIPPSCINPIAQNYLPFFPLPNSRGDAPTTTRNFVAVTNASLGNDAWHVKSDYLWNEKHRTTATITQNWGFA